MHRLTVTHSFTHTRDTHIDRHTLTHPHRHHYQRHTYTQTHTHSHIHTLAFRSRLLGFLSHRMAQGAQPGVKGLVADPPRRGRTWHRLRSCSTQRPQGSSSCGGRDPPRSNRWDVPGHTVVPGKCRFHFVVFFAISVTRSSAAPTSREVGVGSSQGHFWCLPGGLGWGEADSLQRWCVCLFLCVLVWVCECVCVCGGYRVSGEGTAVQLAQSPLTARWTPGEQTTDGHVLSVGPAPGPHLQAGEILRGWRWGCWEAGQRGDRVSTNCFQSVLGGPALRPRAFP